MDGHDGHPLAREPAVAEPGVFDMKSGLLVALYAVRALIESGETPWQTLTMLCNSDEEIGSPESHDLIEAEARQADVVLVLEPTSDVARVTVARKGAAMPKAVRGESVVVII